MGACRLLGQSVLMVTPRKGGPRGHGGDEEAEVWMYEPNAWSLWLASGTASLGGFEMFVS